MPTLEGYRFGLAHAHSQRRRSIREPGASAAHPGVVLWVWANFFLDQDRILRRRVLVR
jgi:hypothetical protein